MARKLPVFYGWIVVGTITAILMATNGSRLLFGVVLKPMSEEFGWERSDLSVAILINMVVVSAAQPFAGWLTDRLGAKRMMVGGVALIAVTLIPFSLVESLWQVYLIYGLIGGIAFTAATPVNSAALVNRWFVRRRGTALSIATAGTPVGQLIIVPIAAAVLLATDWQTTYRLLALLLVAMIPLGTWLLRNDPAEIGEVPDGRRDAGKAPESAGARERARAQAAADAAPATLRQAMRTPAFWLYAYGFLVCGFTMAFANLHFLAYADDMGMHASLATTAISVTAAFSIAGTILLGMLADRSDRPPVLALTYALRGVSFFLLYAFGTGPFVYVYAIVLGISWSATTPLTAAIAADIYGRRNIGVIFGTMFMAMNLGFGIGAFFDGVIFDELGHYRPALVINGLAGLSAAALIYFYNVGRSARRRAVVAEPQPGALAAAD